MDGQINIMVEHSASNIQHQDKEHSNVALGMCEAGPNMNGQMNIVIQHPATNTLRQDRENSNGALA